MFANSNFVLGSAGMSKIIHLFEFSVKGSFPVEFSHLCNISTLCYPTNPNHITYKLPHFHEKAFNTTSKWKLFPGKSRIEIIVEDARRWYFGILEGGKFSKLAASGEKFYWLRKYFVQLSNKSPSVEHLRPLFHLDRHKNFFICLRGNFMQFFN